MLLRLLITLIIVSCVIAFYVSYRYGISIDEWLEEKVDFYFSDEKHEKEIEREAKRLEKEARKKERK